MPERREQEKILKAGLRSEGLKCSSRTLCLCMLFIYRLYIGGVNWDWDPLGPNKKVQEGRGGVFIFGEWVVRYDAHGTKKSNIHELGNVCCALPMFTDLQ